MELILKDNSSNKEVILYSNNAERGIDFVTTIYESKEDFLESLNLDPKKFTVTKRYKDKNGMLDEEILTYEYKNIFDILDSEEEQKEFENDIFKCDLNVVRNYIHSVYLQRAKYSFNSYLKKSKNPIVNLFEEMDCLQEIRSRDNYPKSIIKDGEKKYKEAIHSYLYEEEGKPYYANFLGFYKVLCDENVLEKNNEQVDSDIKENVSSLFREKLVKYVNDNEVKHESKSALIKLDSLKKKLGEYKKYTYDDQPLHSAITESYGDIDEFETNLDILMDEQGLSDDEKIIARSEMRKRFEKNKNL